MTAPPLPTIEDLEAMPFPAAVAAVIAAAEYALAGFQHRAAVRRSEGRSLSAADSRALSDLVLALEALRADVRERLAPGTSLRELRQAFARAEEYRE